ncbi:MAG: MerR family transcriptional regulator [Candidatus Onthomorpha sp.]|nr:MerR family transcriptional regulator [Bacteroidales bacterium]MDD7590715.1 MerR family transcriptional regulator [Bacteroidales bacterium]MDY5825801.1 MerR family transcriptional regulator [Candidatus Onthomorpha sp.]
MTIFANMKDKLFYTISEVSEELKVSQPTLRFWEREFKQIKPHRTLNGQRRYTKEDVEVLRKIKALTHERGLTLSGAKKILRGAYNDLPEQKDIAIDTLQELKTFLSDLKSQMDILLSEDDLSQTQDTEKQD